MSTPFKSYRCTRPQLSYKIGEFNPRKEQPRNLTCVAVCRWRTWSKRLSQLYIQNAMTMVSLSGADVFYETKGTEESPKKLLVVARGRRDEAYSLWCLAFISTISLTFGLDVRVPDLLLT